MEKFSPFWADLHTKKANSLVNIGFTDASDPRVIEAALLLGKENLLRPVLIDFKNVGPEDLNRYSDILLQKQSRLKLTKADVDAQLKDSLYLGIAMLLDGKVDGLVSGSLRPTGDVVKAALSCVGTREGQRLVSGHFLVESSLLSSSDGTPFLFADCAVMPEPSPQAIAVIARSAADSYRFFTGKSPRVALLSFSTKGSAQHALVDRIKEALAIIKKQDPSLIVDGEIQADAALDSKVAAIKNAGNSPVAGKANVFIFPTLEAGNISYKLVQRFSTAKVAGPILWGLSKPMSDLSRGCTVDEIVDTALCVSALSTRMN